MTAASHPPAKMPLAIAFVLAVAAGYALIMLMPHTTPAEPLPAPEAWYQSVRIAVITTMRLPVGVLLFLCGLGLGWVQPRYWFLLALSLLTLLPVAAISELVASRSAPTFLTLLEFVMFFCMALPALGGAAISRMIRYKGLPGSESAIF